MAVPLPRLRMNLDFMPSPAAERPGLLVRDPFHFSDATLIIPPALVECLQLFDAAHTDLDLRAALVRITGDLQVSELEQHLVNALSEAGFLENPQYEQMRKLRQRDFAAATQRLPLHAGSAYPAEPEALRKTLAHYLNGAAVSGGELLGVAAPHASPEGGWQSYGAAYGALNPGHQDRIFVILGTSHYSEPETFGLTTKTFVTPFGETRAATSLIHQLAGAAGGAARMEDYCHAIEHSIEFQIVFLQHLFGANIRVVPILCGPFARGLQDGGRPENDPQVARFLDALGEMAAREGDRLSWVLGVDMAHMGRRYGDPFRAQAGVGEMTRVEAADRRRIGRLTAGDADGFWELVREQSDPLKWCGAAPFYTFLRANPRARGELLHYQQWNIDEQSVVTFAGMAFRG